MTIKVGYARIRRRAQELLSSVNATPPVDVEAIAGQLGISIRKMSLEADVSGILYREDDKKIIVVNENHPVVRQRFTIAHEIGHLLLHAGDAVHVDQEFRINLRDQRSATAENIEEIEANAFAANLLMPASWLRREMSTESVDLIDDGEIQSLADRYGVSAQAMILRLSNISKL